MQPVTVVLVAGAATGCCCQQCAVRHMHTAVCGEQDVYKQMALIWGFPEC